MIKINKICLLIIALLTSFGTTQPRIGRLIMLLDDTNGITTDAEQLDIAVFTFIEALQQKTAPILISNSIWNDFAFRRKNAHEKIKAFDPLYYLFFKIYNDINREINELYSKKNIKDQEKLQEQIRLILSDPNAPLTGRIYQIYKMPTFKGTQAQERERYASMLCYFAPFDPKDWDIYFIENSLTLLIPHEYKNTMAQEAASLSNKTNFSTEEIALNFKTAGFTKQKIDDKYDLPMTGGSRLSSNVFSKIFIGKDDVRGNANIDELLVQWNIFLEGHGMYSQSNMQILTLLKKTQKLHEEVGFVRNPEPSTISDLKPKMQHKIIELVESQTKLEKAIKKAKGSIVGLTIEKFQSLISFFNKQLVINFLFYNTCFAADVHLILPYITLGFTQPMNFTTVTGALTSKETLARVSPNLLPFATVQFPIVFIGEQPAFGLASTTRFDMFFNALDFDQLKAKKENPKPFKTIINYVHPFLSETGTVLRDFVGNIPLINISGTWLPVPGLEEFVTSFNKVTTSTAKLRKKFEVLVPVKKAILLYQAYVPVNISFTLAGMGKGGFELPYVVPMLADQLLYYIKSLESPDYSLLDFIQSFTLDKKQEASKAFLIDSLSCKAGFLQLQFKESELKLEKVVFANKMAFPPAPEARINVLFIHKGKGYRYWYSESELAQIPIGTIQITPNYYLDTLQDEVTELYKAQFDARREELKSGSKLINLSDLYEYLKKRHPKKDKK